MAPIQATDRTAGLLRPPPIGVVSAAVAAAAVDEGLDFPRADAYILERGGIQGAELAHGLALSLPAAETLPQVLDEAGAALDGPVLDDGSGGKAGGRVGPCHGEISSNSLSYR